jgi:hypothetical protein
MQHRRFRPDTHAPMRLSLPTVGVLVAVVGAGAFAAGHSMSPDSPSSFSSPAAAQAAVPMEMNEGTEQLPPGHPPVDSIEQGGSAAATLDVPPPEQTSLEWKAPARWQVVANASTMRLATYRVPRAPGDVEDAEMSITQAGGSVEANAQRWVGQFDAAGQKTAKLGTRKVGALDVTIVWVQGNYSAGMTMDAGSRSGWALLGAIVATPGMPHFFKLTGPAKSVAAARAEFDAMIATIAPL